MIEELKDVNRALEHRLREKGEVHINKMLEEDGESLRRAIFKLEGVNDKLNNDIALERSEKREISSQLMEFKKQNKSL